VLEYLKGVGFIDICQPAGDARRQADFLFRLAENCAGSASAAHSKRRGEPPGRTVACRCSASTRRTANQALGEAFGEPLRQGGGQAKRATFHLPDQCESADIRSSVKKLPKN